MEAQVGIETGFSLKAKPSKPLEISSEVEIRKLKKGDGIRTIKLLAVLVVLALTLTQKPPYKHSEAMPSTDKQINNSAQEAPRENPKKEPEVKKVETPVQPIPKPSPKPIQPKPVTYSGSKQQWMSQAGIPESQWQYVDYIVSKESSWNPNAVNPNGGACGLVQALPCSKLGTNWNDPVTALKWQHNYVNARYGGYAGAYSFWVANHWY